MNSLVFGVLVFVVFVLLDKLYDKMLCRRLAVYLSVLTLCVLICFIIFVFHMISKSPFEVQGEGNLVNTYVGTEVMLYSSVDETEVTLKNGVETYRFTTDSDLFFSEALNEGEMPYVEEYEVSVKKEWFGIYEKSTERLVKAYLPENVSGLTSASDDASFCINCGAGLETTYNFCPDCGFEVK